MYKIKEIMQLESSRGRILGAVLLIAGSTIGAGMLGLPIVTGLAGFVPAIIVFLACWAFMTITGLLLLEVNLWLGQRVNIVSFAEKTLGQWAKWVSGIIYVFLFYSLLIAYMDASGSLFSAFISAFFGVAFQDWVGSLFFLLLFGVCVYLGTRPVDFLNRIFMAGLIISYVLLIGLGMQAVDTTLLSYSKWQYSFLAIPVVITSFGFHNMIPSISDYLQGNKKHLIYAIVIGSALPLVVYVLWEWLILGIVPFSDQSLNILSMDSGDVATQSLKMVLGSSWIATLSQYFAFFAITTSFLAQALSLVDFLGDAFHFRRKHSSRLLLCCFVLIPPFVFAMTYPGVFLIALGYAGGFGAVILFGILPALMVWVLRYRKKESLGFIVPGGRTLLSIIIIIGTGVILFELLKEIFGADTLINFLT